MRKREERERGERERGERERGEREREGLKDDGYEKITMKKLPLAEQGRECSCRSFGNHNEKVTIKHPLQN